jgi:tetratricopeptide (TPR) repeat protein
VALGPFLAEAHTSSADVKLYADWNFAGAEQEFRRALDLNPNYATAHQWYAEFLSLTRRQEEAVREIRRAQQLEPLSVVMYHQAGQIYQNARRYDEAIQQYNKALEIDPTFYPSSGRLADAFRHKGKYQEAIATEQEFFRRHASSFFAPGGDAALAADRLALAYRAGGVRGYWRARLKTHQEESYSILATYQISIDYGQLGDTADGLRWLSRAYDAHLSEVLSLNVDPDLDPLRGDPRFQELVHRIGLP